MALDQYKTQILLLHSQQSTLDRFVNGFDDHYSVHVATSGTEALHIFNDTPVHVIVSAQDLPGMSGLDALREAKKRSPETIGILLAGNNQNDGLEALVGDQEVFQIVRGEITASALVSLIDSVTKRARLLTLSVSANDTLADVDHGEAEHIIMETSENGSSIISGGTGRIPILKPEKISVAADTGGRSIDVLVLTKDEEFLATVRDSTRGLHNVHHAVTVTQADEFVRKNKVGILVTDAAMVGSNIDVLTQRLRQSVPRLVAVVAGRRDDGELLMDLINKGQVYRFLLKPVSPGRARLAIEASVKHHLEAPEKAFKSSAPSRAAAPAPAQIAPPAASPSPKAPQSRPPAQKITSTQPMNVSRGDSLLKSELDSAFGDDSSFTQTMTGLAVSVGKKIAAVTESISFSKKETGASAALPSPLPAPDRAPAPAVPPRTAAATRAPAPAATTSPAAPTRVPVPAPAPARVNVSATRVTRAPEFALSDTIQGPFRNSKLLIAVAAGALVIALAGWFFFGGDDEAPVSLTDEPSATPVFAESDIVPSQPAPDSAVSPSVAAEETLIAARQARDAGQLISPENNNAVGLYLSAIQLSPDNAEIAAELDAVVEQIVGLAETAIIEQRLDVASSALLMIERANPDYARLAFLNTQLHQLQFHKHIDSARLAIREGRFEDAGSLINSAATVPGSNADEVKVLSEELARSRSEQRVDEVLELANARMEQNNLISPSNNNARYYYELALSTDPGNTAARQGLIIVASKLVLQARAAIDAGQLNNANDLLRNARSLDPNSAELAATSSALDDATANAARAEAAEAKALADKLAADKLAADKLAADKLAADKRAADKIEADRLAEVERNNVAERERQRLAAEAAAVTAAAASVAKSSTSADAAGAGAIAASKPEKSVSSADSAGDVSSKSATGAEDGAVAVAAVANKAIVPGAPPATSGSAVAVENRVPEANVSSARSGGTANAEPQTVAVSALTRINYVAPKYPRSAQRRNITGSVDLTFRVLTDGTVTDIAVVNSTPGNTFDQAAMDAVAEWRFEASIEDGIAVEKRTAVRLAFNLQ